MYLFVYKIYVFNIILHLLVLVIRNLLVAHLVQSPQVRHGDGTGYRAPVEGGLGVGKAEGAAGGAGQGGRRCQLPVPQARRKVEQQKTCRMLKSLSGRTVPRLHLELRAKPQTPPRAKPYTTTEALRRGTSSYSNHTFDTEIMQMIQNDISQQ